MKFIKNMNHKHLLIDSERHIFDQFYYNYINTINLLHDSNKLLAKKDRQIITEKDYIVCCLNVLISLPSESFFLKKVSINFLLIR